jgi:hypothetical protein
LTEKRDQALAISAELAGIASTGRQNNASDSVKRQASLNRVQVLRKSDVLQALVCYINIHILFSKRSEAPAAKVAHQVIPDETQHRLTGAFEAAVENWERVREIAGEESEYAPEGQLNPAHGLRALQPS